MSEPVTYTAKDFERYHHGEMSAAEMHELEKAALDDPMLADALEGYRYTTHASNDLQNLQNRLQQRIDKDKRRGVLFFSQPWIRIAALFLLVAGGGWLVFQTFSTKRNDLAKNNSNELTGREKKRAAKPADTTATTVQNIAPLITPDSLQDKDKNSIVENRKVKQTNQQVPATEPKVATESLAKNGLSAGAARAMNALNTERKGADSTSQIAALKERTASPMYQAANDTIKHLNIVLQKNEVPIDEVVISKTKQQATARKMAIVVDTLEPQQGWRSFDDYVAENIREPEELKQKLAAEGEVELSFEVDKEGNPINIIVTKSLCQTCDAEAIRLLKEGPKWKIKKAKGKVKIKF